MSGDFHSVPEDQQWWVDQWAGSPSEFQRDLMVRWLRQYRHADERPLLQAFPPFCVVRDRAAIDVPGPKPVAFVSAFFEDGSLQVKTDPYADDDDSYRVHPGDVEVVAFWKGLRPSVVASIMDAPEVDVSDEGVHRSEAAAFPTALAMIASADAAASPLRAAARELRLGDEHLGDLLKTYARASDGQLAGRVAEVVHEATFNADSVRKGQPWRAVRTAPQQPHAAADIVITGPRGPVSSVQLKYRSSAKSTATALARPHYAGMQKVVPREQLLEVTRHARRRQTALARRGHPRAAQMADTAKNARDRVVVGRARSAPLSSAEARSVRADPDCLGRLAAKTEVLAVRQAALWGAGVGAAISIAEQARLLRSDETTPERAVVAVAADAAKGAAVGVVGAVGASFIRGGLARAGAQALAKGAAPVAIAFAAVDLSRSAVQLGSGEITGADFGRKAAVTTGEALGAWGGAEIGAAVGTAILPGAGTVVFGLAGALVGALGGGAVLRGLFS